MNDSTADAPLLDAIDRWLEKQVKPQAMRLEHDDAYPRQMVETMKLSGVARAAPFRGIAGRLRAAR